MPYHVYDLRAGGVGERMHGLAGCGRPKHVVSLTSCLVHQQPETLISQRYLV